MDLIWLEEDRYTDHEIEWGQWHYLTALSNGLIEEIAIGCARSAVAALRKFGHCEPGCPDWRVESG
jgi:hypothetical protein